MPQCSSNRRARTLAFLGPMLTAVLLASAPIGAQAPATPEPALAPGPGMELTMQRCVICHEVQHITRSRLTRAEWLENTELMIKRGAPVAAGEIAPIVDYLFAYYGRNDDGSARPRPAGAAAAASAAAPSAGGSRDVQTVLAAYGCTGCHAVDRKMVGPSFRDVANRFGSETDGHERVARRIREGGAGAWGSIPMPPHPAIDDDELRALVTWVFAQR
jgi:sulfite dehydrogenase